MRVKEYWFGEILIYLQSGWQKPDLLCRYLCRSAHIWPAYRRHLPTDGICMQIISAADGICMQIKSVQICAEICIFALERWWKNWQKIFLFAYNEQIKFFFAKFLLKNWNLPHLQLNCKNLPICLFATTRCQISRQEGSMKSNFCLCGARESCEEFGHEVV